MKETLVGLSLSWLAIALSAGANAQSWRQALPATSPPARLNHCGAFDIARGRLVVHGGENGTVLGDTWEFDGSNWLATSPAASPGPVWAGSMAYDLTTASTILFGGAATISGAPLGATWRWNGTTWTQLQPPQSPPPLVAHAMVCELANSRIVLFGGRDTSGAEVAATWTFDGTTWTQLGGPQPPARCCHDLAFDLGRGVTMLFGGWSTTSYGDTWELVANTWVQRQPAVSPSPRWGHRMAYDITSQSIVMHGGGIGPSYIPTDESWRWDGTSWQALPTSGPVRINAVLHQDLGGNRLVMFGGGWATSDETWTFGITVPGTFTAFGSACGGPLGTPQLTGGTPPTIGNVATMQLTGAPLVAVFALGGSNTSWGGIPLPLSLAPDGMPGCSLLVSRDASVTRTPTAGTATLAVPIPWVPALVGTSFHGQGASLDLGANALGLTVSNALTATIGW